jgi:hypothetical protein
MPVAGLPDVVLSGEGLRSAPQAQALSARKRAAYMI